MQGPVGGSPPQSLGQGAGLALVAGMAVGQDPGCRNGVSLRRKAVSLHRCSQSVPGVAV
ncbi:hypothetical protein AZ78_2174 [Lysobacter capsici AZ78]|uniref:Uncharacterized protein n=1 Tax=Lysobacter capsici AZ78 TaxID=1444315 RepID=A0A108U8R1_9GAMM|nr:hypothetical protein AZ78_2174 [Lysobacter capsici AZ78]